MMLATKKRYDDFAYDRVKPEARFDGGAARVAARSTGSASRGSTRLAWGAAYTLFYFTLRHAPVDVARSCPCTSSWARSTAPS